MYSCGNDWDNVIKNVLIQPLKTFQRYSAAVQIAMHAPDNNSTRSGRILCWPLDRCTRYFSSLLELSPAWPCLPVVLVVLP